MFSWLYTCGLADEAQNVLPLGYVTRLEVLSHIEDVTPAIFPVSRFVASALKNSSYFAGITGGDKFGPD